MNEKFLKLEKQNFVNEFVERGRKNYNAFPFLSFLFKPEGVGGYQSNLSL